MAKTKRVIKKGKRRTVDEWVKIAEEIGCANYKGKKALDKYMKMFNKSK